MRRAMVAGGMMAATLVIGGVATPAGPAQATATCNFKTVTIQGTEGDDTLVGTAGADVISAGGGNDTVQGLAGNDTVCLGLGNDTFDGGDGHDYVEAEAVVDGNDSLVGGAGVDVASYGSRTSGVHITLDDVANDGGASESDDVRADIERVVSGAGADSLFGNAGPNILDGNTGIDHINGGGGNDDLSGGEGGDFILGGPGDDVIDGGGGDDSFLADSTVDGSDWFLGGTGSDTADYHTRTSGVTASLDGLSDDGAPGEADNLQPDVENIVGGSGNDTLRIFLPSNPTGVVSDNFLFGGPGNDTIVVSDGIFDSQDRAHGAGGFDTCFINPGLDQAIECETTILN